MKKRVCSLLLCLILTVSLLPAAAFAASAESRIFYPQLSGYAKNLFHALETSENLRQLSAGGTVSLTVDGPFSDPNLVAGELAKGLPTAFAALELEHLELFWLKGYSANISGNASRLTVTLSPAVGYNWSAGLRSLAADKATVDTAVKKLAAEAAEQGGTYERLLYVHDWLTEHNVYNSAAAASGADYDYLPFSPLSALTDVSQPVCEGYAKAFKLVCDELNIPCVLVCGQMNGVGHAWNEVKLDGSWYAVDATVDDPIVPGVNSLVSGAERHDYFLIGANTVVGGVAFSNSRLTTGEYMKGEMFSYPTLSPDAYHPSASVTPAEPVAPQGSLFADVPDDAYYASAVEWAVNHEPQVTNGVGNDRFGPDQTVTRGQAMTFLWRAAGCPEPKTVGNPFLDINASEYWYKPILWASETGIANGTGNGRYSPNQTCTNAHIVTFLYRAAGEPGKTGAGTWYEDAVRWAAGMGLFTGTDEVFDPGIDCPRKDIVLFLYRQLSGEYEAPQDEYRSTLAGGRYIIHIDGALRLGRNGSKISGR